MQRCPQFRIRLHTGLSSGCVETYIFAVGFSRIAKSETILCQRLFAGTRANSSYFLSITLLYRNCPQLNNQW
jgi:hypothetical protein